MPPALTQDYCFAFTLRNKQYQVRIPASLEHYVLERESWGGLFEKVPCMTDAEERRFPKDAGYVATAYLQGLREGRASQ